MKVSRRVLAMTVAGVGLIFVGIAIAVRLAQQTDQATQPTDFSAIPVAVNIDAPPLTLTNLKGNQQTLLDYRGQVVLVNLWATWCPPCKAEMPILQAFYVLHQREGFTVVAIEDGDPKPDVLTFVDQFGLTFPVWLDPTYQATDQAFKTMNLPSSYVIDRMGKIRLEWFGAISTVNLEKYLTPILKEL